MRASFQAGHLPHGCAVPSILDVVVSKLIPLPSFLDTMSDYGHASVLPLKEREDGIRESRFVDIAASPPRAGCRSNVWGIAYCRPLASRSRIR
jgi:hypothetical protein